MQVVLGGVQAGDPAWFAIIADEATDVTCTEQLNMSVRYVDHHSEVHEHSVGLFQAIMPLGPTARA